MPCINFRQLHLRIHHQGNHEQVVHQPGSFAHVIVQGIIIQLAVADAGIALKALRIQRKGMVMTNRIHGTDARQDALPSAAEAGHDVMGTRTQANDTIRMSCRRVNPHYRAVRRCADGHQIVCQAVVIDHLNPVINPVCD